MHRIQTSLAWLSDPKLEWIAEPNWVDQRRSLVHAKPIRTSLGPNPNGSALKLYIYLREDPSALPCPLFSENEDLSDDEIQENYYEEVFDQILGSFKKPKPISLWEHSVPNSPVPFSPFESPPSHKMDSASKVRPKMPTPRNQALSNVFSAIGRCNSDDYTLRSTPSSPKGDLKLNNLRRVSERRFSDVTTPYSPDYESVQARKRFNYQRKPQTPPSPAPRRKSKGNISPIMVTNGYTQQISIDDDVFKSSPTALKVSLQMIRARYNICP